MKNIIIFLLLVFITSCNYSIINTKDYEKNINIVCENAYFEGQKDAINGDIRIKLNSDSIYIWIKSPWNNVRKPTFIPTYLDSK